MLKKFILTMSLLLCVSLGAYASSLDSIFNAVDQTLDRVDRVYGTYGKYIPKEETSTENSNTYSKPSSTTQRNDNIPEYNSNERVDVPETRYTQTQNNEYTAQVKTLKDLPAGTLIMDPSSVWKYRGGDNYSGGILASLPVIWIKLEDNHYAQGATLLFSEVSVARYPFCHQNKGLRAWDESDLRRFLRTTFYNHLSEGFKNSIVNVSIPFADLNGNPKTVVDNFFLLSIVEWGLSDRQKNGTVIKYDDIPDIYAGRTVKYVDSWGALDLDKSSTHSWTRTINRPVAKSAGYSNEVFETSGDGVLNTTYSWTNYPMIRPAVNLKSSTPVKGPYKLKYYVNNNKYLIYYALAF